MAVIQLKGLPSEKEIEWLSKNIGDRKTWLPHYVSGKGWVIKQNHIVFQDDGTKYPTSYQTVWTLEFEDAKMASYYTLKFK